VADVTQPFIGADFLSHYGLAVDFKCKRLLDNVTSLSTPAQAANSRIPSVKNRAPFRKPLVVGVLAETIER
jgi:hypothetical protein